MKLIDKKFLVVRRLGSGFSGDVYEVTADGRSYALKLLKSGFGGLGETESRDIFQGEFRLLRSLHHPGIVQIFDFGFDTACRRFYFTEELVPGVPFSRWTEGKGEAAIRASAIQILRALAYLHSYGICHQDIKPENILMAQVAANQPQVKLIDFGLAEFRRKGLMGGTPAYLAPEVLERKPFDERSDLYALGVLLYAALTGNNPFFAPTVAETTKRHATFIPPPPREVMAGLSPGWDQVLGRLLAKDPAERYQHAVQVIRDCYLLFGEEPVVETRESLLAYLPRAGQMIGRAEELGRLCALLDQLRDPTANGSQRVVALVGPSGSGKSFLLGEVRAQAQLRGLRCVEPHQWREDLPAPYVLIADAVEGSDDLVSDILYQSAGQRALIVIASREAKWVGSEGILVRLNNFSQEEVGQYLAAVAGVSTIPPNLVAELYRHTEGNPLRVRETVAGLITAGLLFDEAGRWAPATYEERGLALQSLSVPQVIEAHAAERLRRLHAPEKALLQGLAAWGRPVELSECDALGEVEQIAEQLLALQRHDLVERLPDKRWRIRNPYLQKVALVSASEAERMAHHDRIRASLSQRDGDPDEIAWHTAFGSDPRRALDAIAELTLRCRRDGRLEDVERLQRQALHLLAANGGEAHLSAQIELADTMVRRGDRNAIETFREIEGQLARYDNPAMRLRALERLGLLHLTLGRFGEARGCFEQGQALLVGLPNAESQAMVLENYIGATLLHEGKLGEAEALFRRTRERWVQWPLQQRQAVKNNDLGHCLLTARRWVEAMAIFQDDLAFFTAAGEAAMWPRICYGLAEGAIGLRQFPEAQGHLETCITQAKATDQWALAFRAYNSLGNIAREEGEDPEALQYYQRALALARQTGDRASVAGLSVSLGIQYHRLGEPAEAERNLLYALHICRGLPTRSQSDEGFEARALVELAHLMIEQGATPKARALLEEARAKVAALPTASLAFWVDAAEAKLAFAVGEVDRGETLLAALRQRAATDAERDSVLNIEPWRKKEAHMPSAVEPTQLLDQYRHKVEALEAELVTLSQIIRPEAELSKMRYPYAEIVARSKEMRDVLQLLDRITETNIAVFIHGETGTGKELIARALHTHHPQRAAKAFVAINCSAIPPALFEGELFGYVRGAFTGAVREKKGFFEEADGGTLFLDEVADLDLALQAKLLRVLQERQVVRLGETRPRPIDVRVVSASNRDLQVLVKNDQFREDLYYRLCELRVHLPPLRERREDIPLLMKKFAAEYAREQGSGAPLQFDRDVMRRFLFHNWPGNVRELESVFRVCCAIAEGNIITMACIPPSSPLLSVTVQLAPAFVAKPRTRNVEAEAGNVFDPQMPWRKYEEVIIAKALAHNGYRPVLAARMLGISYAKMRAWMKALGLADQTHPLFSHRFPYRPDTTLHEYRREIFQAALVAAGGRPYKAIRLLQVSQGHFYKVIRKEAATQ